MSTSLSLSLVVFRSYSGPQLPQTLAHTLRPLTYYYYNNIYTITATAHPSIGIAIAEYIYPAAA